MESEWALDRMRLYQLRRDHPDCINCAATILTGRWRSWRERLGTV